MMKRYWMFLFYAVSVALMVACGGASSTATPIANPTAEPTVAPQESPTQVITPTQETTPTQEPTQPTGPLGTLEFRVTDQPADAVTSIKITIKDIEVHISGGEEMSGWRTVVEGPSQFDLMELMDIEDLLGSATLESG